MKKPSRKYIKPHSWFDLREDDRIVDGDFDSTGHWQHDYRRGCNPSSNWYPLPEGARGPELLDLPQSLCEQLNDWVRRYCEHDDATPEFDRKTYNAEQILELIGDKHEAVYRGMIPMNVDHPEAKCVEEVIGNHLEL